MAYYVKMRLILNSYLATVKAARTKDHIVSLKNRTIQIQPLPRNKYLFGAIIFGSIALLFLSGMVTSFHRIDALSPSFGLQEVINENRTWVQTYGNSSYGLKSAYTDILAVDYISDGKSLNATYWLSSAPKNSTLSIINQPTRRVAYGFLIDADSNSKTGYSGGDYDFYLESSGGKLSAYLYQLSSLGGYRLLDSNINFSESYINSNLGPGFISLTMTLDTLNYPSKYNLLFYSAESSRSNEVRQFTGWVSIPPPKLQLVTTPSNIMIKQGEDQLVPARIRSSTGFSNDINNITLGGINNNEALSDFNASEIHIAIQRVQPLLFKVGIPGQTSLGTYSIPVLVTIREPSVATLTKSPKSEVSLDTSISVDGDSNVFADTDPIPGVDVKLGGPIHG
jgi:hypothetical protein